MIASSKKHIMPNYCYLNNNPFHRIPAIQREDDLIIVRPGNLPCLAFFNEGGKLSLSLCHPEIEYKKGFVTCLTRDDFPKEEQLFSNYDPIDGSFHASFIVILPKPKLEEMGFQVETRKGWMWDPEKFRSIEIECPDKTKKAWCPATKNWEKPCDCEKCKTSSHEKYVHSSVIKSLYYSLPAYLRNPHDIGNPLAEFANKCTCDEVNYCYACGGCFACEKECVLYDPHF